MLALVRGLESNGTKTYAKLFQKIQTNRPLAAISRDEYDVMGDRIRQIDPEIRITTNTYDLRRRLLSSSNGAGETATTTSFFSCPDDRNLPLLDSLVEYGYSGMLEIRLFLHSIGVAIHVIAQSCEISSEELIH